MRKNRGFTLIESLVAISIFAVLSTVTTGTFLYIMGGVVKAKKIRQLKQNGAVVLEKIERAVRDAREMKRDVDLDCNDTNDTQLYLITESDKPRVIRCGVEDSVNTIEIDGISLTDKGVQVTACSFNCKDTEPPTVEFNLTLEMGGLSEEFSIFVSQRKY